MKWCNVQIISIRVGRGAFVSVIFLTKEVILCSLYNAFLFQGSWELHNTRSSQSQKPNYLILRKQYLHAIKLLTLLMWVVWISAWRILAGFQLHMCKFWQGLVFNHVNLEALLSFFSAANLEKLHIRYQLWKSCKINFGDFKEIKGNVIKLKCSHLNKILFPFQ